ncbi:UNVERIFIED_CONTAM: hypothetical protein K2H54_062200 [Gekko kuhli]
MAVAALRMRAEQGDPLALGPQPEATLEHKVQTEEQDRVVGKGPPAAQAKDSRGRWEQTGEASSEEDSACLDAQEHQVPDPECPVKENVPEQLRTQESSSRESGSKIHGRAEVSQQGQWDEEESEEPVSALVFLERKSGF